jgi:hypothetical protein
MTDPIGQKPEKRKPIPFDEVARRLLGTPPPSIRKPKAKRVKSK